MRGGRSSSWLLLLALTMPLLAGLEYARVPGSLLVGSLIAGITVALRHGTLKLPKVAYDLSQGLIACFVAHSITPTAVVEFSRHFPVYVLAVVATIAMATLCGTWLARRGAMAAQSAIFGSFPGAAAAMVLVAENGGADARMVAVMQYSRVVVVTMSTALVGFFDLDANHFHSASALMSMPADSWKPALTVLFAVVTSLIGYWSGIAAGTFLVPLGLAGLLSGSGFYVFAVPGWLTLPCFVLIGWTIGLQFDATSFRVVIRAMPHILLAILMLIGGCFLVAVLLRAVTGMDLMTAYLATSPGGLDAAVLIAVNAHADAAFVTGLQTTRLIFVLLFGPMIAKRVVRWVAARPHRS